MFKHDAASLVVETADGKERLERIFPNKKIYIVSNTYNPVFDQKDLWDYLALPAFSGTTLLTVSAPYPHKNLQIIRNVATYLQKTYPDFKFRFIVTTNAKFFGFSNDNYPDWLLPLGKVSINQCPSLYQQADIMFLPTLMEIFSANYPEAMRMNVPIATSDLSFAHGIWGNAAEFFNPLSPIDIGESIYHLATDSTYRNLLVKLGKERLAHFADSSGRATAYLQILEEIAK